MIESVIREFTKYNTYLNNVLVIVVIRTETRTTTVSGTVSSTPGVAEEGLPVDH